MGKSDIKNVVSIAGVDPSGGAGLLADIKSFSAAGVYGTGVVTALTAQNTCAVTGVFPIPGAFIRQQIDTPSKSVCSPIRKSLRRWPRD